MLSEFFESSARIQALSAGSAGELVERFAQALFRAGYAEITARRHLRAVEHFVFWADRSGTAIGDLGEQTLNRFGHHLLRCRCPKYGRSDRGLLYGVRLFLRHLEEAGVIKVSAVGSTVADPPVLIAFSDWMRQQRGTCEATLSGYAIHIRELLDRVGEAPEALNARSLQQFVIEGSQRYGWASAKKRTTALRMFVRYLIVEGRCAAGLEAAVPVLAHWRLASLPRYLQPDDVEHLIASCEAASPIGRRDRAILLLLARLGLRAGDIVQLRLQDIDWKGGWIQVSGKGRRRARLPLTDEVGHALAAYVTGGRPSTEADSIFIRSRAPFRGFRSHSAVSVIVDCAFRRSQVIRPSRGAAHLLRHSVATCMLRHGASLQEVSALLRHRSIATTQIYAKVDVTALRRIAQPWPEVRSC